MINPVIKIPDAIKANEAFTIRTRVSHPMHSGRLRDAEGRLIPRKIVRRFECRFGDQLVFACDLEPAMAENPYLEFRAALPVSGAFLFIWFEDGGQSLTERRDVAVS